MTLSGLEVMAILRIGFSSGGNYRTGMSCHAQLGLSIKENKATKSLVIVVSGPICPFVSSSVYKTGCINAPDIRIYNYYLFGGLSPLLCDFLYPSQFGFEICFVLFPTAVSRLY